MLRPFTVLTVSSEQLNTFLHITKKESCDKVIRGRERGGWGKEKGTVKARLKGSDLWSKDKQGLTRDRGR